MTNEQYEKAIRLYSEINSIKDLLLKAKKIKEMGEPCTEIIDLKEKDKDSDEEEEPLIVFDFISGISSSQLLDNYIKDIITYKEGLEEEFRKI